MQNNTMTQQTTCQAVALAAHVPGLEDFPPMPLGLGAAGSRKKSKRAAAPSNSWAQVVRGKETPLEKVEEKVSVVVEEEHASDDDTRAGSVSADSEVDQRDGSIRSRSGSVTDQVSVAVEEEQEHASDDDTRAGSVSADSEVDQRCGSSRSRSGSVTDLETSETASNTGETEYASEASEGLSPLALPFGPPPGLEAPPGLPVPPGLCMYQAPKAKSKEFDVEAPVFVPRAAVVPEPAPSGTRIALRSSASRFVPGAFQSQRSQMMGAEAASTLAAYGVEVAPMAAPPAARPPPGLSMPLCAKASPFVPVVAA